MNLKVFLFWILGLFALVFAGITKYTGLGDVGEGAAIVEVFQKFPKILLAVLGINEIDFTTLGGFYTVISFYVLICGSIYSIHMGTETVTREIQDKTYEFLFSKPRNRNYILTMKSFSATFFLFLFAVLNGLFSAMAVSAMKYEEKIGGIILLTSVVLFLTELLFFSIGICIASYSKNYNRASFFGNLFFLFAFLLNILFHSLEDNSVLKVISPLNYFEPKDLVRKVIDPGYLILTMIVIIILLFMAFKRFGKSDLLLS